MHDTELCITYLHKLLSSGKGADTIAAILSNGKLIEEVHLNDLKVKDVTKIVMGLQNNSTLKTLSFINNHVTSMTLHNLAAILSHNPKLQVLDLNNTNFTVLTAQKQKY